MVKGIILSLAIAAAANAGEKTYSAGEVAKHRSQSDCWLTIDGSVYDVSEYVARHRKFDYDIKKHCGSEASELWQNKPGSGEAHSRKADRLLKKYRIGAVRK